MNKDQKDYLEKLAKEGWKIQLDKNDEILFMTYWHPEIIVSKIDLKDTKK